MNRRSTLKVVSVGAGLAALLAEGSIKNILVTLLVTVGTPATATGFVYTVSAMREASLAREAADKNLGAPKKAKTDAEAGDDDQPIGAANPDADPFPDMPRRLDVMLNERAGFFSLVGKTSVTQDVYQTTIKKMLKDDDLLFVSLDRHRQNDANDYMDRLAAKALKLHGMHLRLLSLNPDRTAVALGSATTGPTSISLAIR